MFRIKLAAFYLFRTRWWILRGCLWRPGDSDAGEWDSDSAGAGVDRVGRGLKPNTNDQLRGPRPCAGRVRHRRVSIYHLRAERQPFRMGVGDPGDGDTARARRGWASCGSCASSPPIRFAFLTSQHNGPYDALNGLTGLLFVAAVPLVWWRLGAACGLYMLANLWLPLSSGQCEGMGRYCAVLFPLLHSCPASVARGYVAVIAVSALLSHVVPRPVHDDPSDLLRG